MSTSKKGRPGVRSLSSILLVSISNLTCRCWYLRVPGNMDALEDFWNDTPGELSSCDLWAAVSHVVRFSVSGTSLHLLRVATWFPALFDPSMRPLVPSTHCMVHAFHRFFLHPASVLKLSLPLVPMTPPPMLTSNNPIQRSGGFGWRNRWAIVP